MAKMTVVYKKQMEILGEPGTPVSVDEGVAKVKAMAAIRGDRTYKNGRKRKTKDQTVQMVLHLSIDPRQADQMLRGAISLPKGLGKERKVIAFCDAATAEAAKAAGAVAAGADELVEKVAGGWTDFDVAIAHTSMMGKVGKLGRVLGPQGKMPTPKAGTVTAEVVAAVKDFGSGRLEFRNDDGGNIHLPVGKSSFAAGDLKENIEAVIAHIQRVKPATAKGHYMKRVCIAGTRTPSVTLAVGA